MTARLTDEEVERLATHTTQLGLALLQQIDRDGVVRTLAEDGSASVDVVACHHVLEMISVVGAEFFMDAVESLLRWMVDPKNQVLDHPFTLDSLSRVSIESEENTKLFTDLVASRQLADGSIPKYNGYLGGGDFFSTLWCTKILAQYSEEVFRDVLERSFAYLIARRSVAATERHQLGFLGLLLSTSGIADDEAVLREIGREVNRSLTNTSDQQISPLARLFLVEDALAIKARLGIDDFDPSIVETVREVFDLDSDAERIPEAISSVQENAAQSVFFETLARAVIVGTQTLSLHEHEGVASGINKLLHGDYRETRYVAFANTAELRRYIETWGAAHEAFRSYDGILQKIWEKHPYDQSVFLMMPFQDNTNYRTLTRTIKEVCEARGFRAIRVDDKDRRFVERLWDNLVINMLSCKYAIAVYVSEPVVDKMKESEVRLFSNPNVALEYGFFTSRGQQILLLRDKGSPLPTDLQGFLWSSFDIDNADITIPEPVNEWLNRLSGDDDEVDSAEEARNPGDRANG